MEQYQGKSVFGGVAIGRIHVFSKGQQQVKRIKVQDTEAEKKRYREAVQTAITELQGLYDKALKEVGEANAAIFEMHQMMLEDEDFTESVENIIDSQSVNAEYAVASTGDNFANSSIARLQHRCLHLWMMNTCVEGQQMLKIFPNVWFLY